MTSLHATPSTIHLDTHDRAIFGFWVYLMTDTVVFATLFATYAVLHTSTLGGSSLRELVDLPFVLTETLLLLTSSFTCGLGSLALHRGRARSVLAWFSVTLLLGLAFLVLEFSEFSKLSHAGNGPGRSAFLSSYFTLVGTHGLHVALGALWMTVLLVQLFVCGLVPTTVRRLTMLALFWHFLDIIWIFIFTLVYLMGVVAV